MKFFSYFVVAVIVIVLIARFKPQSGPSEPIIPTQLKEAQANPEADKAAPPARTEAQGQADAARGGR